LRAAWAAAAKAGLSRRNLILGAGTAAIGSWVASARTAAADQPAASQPAIRPARELTVQPVLVYHLPQRREQTSWRSWGGIQTPEQVEAEVIQIQKELSTLSASLGEAIRFLPVARVLTVDEAAAVKRAEADVMLVYASGGAEQALNTLISSDRPSLVFLRHRTGPVYLWYETLHPRFMRKGSDRYVAPGLDVNDVVVDEYEDLAWRLRALLALRKTLGQRIVALGGPMGWGDGMKLAPAIAQKKWHLDIRTVDYKELGQRLEALRKDTAAVAAARKQAADYLASPGVSLHTDARFIDNAMLLYRAFKDLMAEHEATAFTIGNCMGTVMPISETTACLPLTLLNDEGLLGFCESDFVVIPSGILMHHITGTPPFLNDPTWPHHGVVTLAHCTAPRRMNGRDLEPVQIHTHFESDYGAAPKVEMSKGQVVTMVVPDFECQKWVGAKGTVESNPFLDICRSQIDVTIDGDFSKLVEDMRGFHWMLVYGDCRREVGYAIKHLGIAWEDVSA
jgi:hypothetical protein